MSGRHVWAALVLSTLPAAGLAAQDPALRLEARSGVAEPVAALRTGPDRGGAIERAPTFGVHLVYRGPSGWGPVVGFSQHRFDCAKDGCPADEYVATTWDLAVQRTLGGHGWARLGAVFGRLERYFPGSSGPLHRTSSLSLGAEAGLGLLVTTRGGVGLSPAVRYGWLNTRFREGGLHRLRWVAADVGLTLEL